MLGRNVFSQPSVMNHDFSKIPHADIPRSSFKRSHGHKTTLNPDYLYPIYADEALPGDTFKVNLSSVCRLMTPLNLPIMDNLYMDYFFFAVPNRLVWNNFQKFMGEQVDPGDSTDFTVPQQTTPSGGYTEESLADHFGIPTKIDNLDPNALHFRAYNLIYNEWFRDQNLIDSLVVDKDDGPDTDTDYVLKKRGKRHDYFTSALPWPQKAPDGAIELPLGSSAPVVTKSANWDYDSSNTAAVRFWAASDGSFAGTTHGASIGASNGVFGPNTGAAETLDFGVQPANLKADLSSATASTINELREAFQLQRLLERDARGGTRYVEILKSHFGVTSPDFRLQRPEYLGGGTQRLTVDPVPSTARNTTILYPGELSAVVYANQTGIGFTKSFVEHCTIVGLCSIRADLTYQKGLNRMWSRQTRYDYYLPVLAHLGEQEILNKEIYAQGTSADEDVFAYQERWAEYRYKPSEITGLLRSNCTTSLDAWHLSQEFASLPVFNETFINEAVPIDRVVTITDEDKFIFDGYFDITCTRPMPMYSVPGMIDHF